MPTPAIAPALPRVRFEAGTLRYSALGLAMVMTWLLVGELGIAMRDRAMIPVSLELLRRFAATDHQVSLLLSGVPAVLSLLVSPLIGPVSDRFRSRWGRRRPFLLALAPLGGLSLLCMALSAKLGTALAPLMPGGPNMALIAFSIGWTVFAAVLLCVQALYSGLVNDVLPQAWLGRFFGLYRMVSLSIGIGFFLWVFPLLDAHPYLIIGVIAAIFTAMLTLMCAMVREGQYPPPAPPPARTPLVTRLRALGVSAMALPGSGWLYGALIFGGLSFGPFNTFSQYYAQTLGVSKADLGELASLAYAVSMVLALPIGVLVDRWGAVRMSLAVMGLYAISIGAGYCLLHDAAIFRPVYLLHVVLSGSYFTAAASLPMALFPRLDFLRYCAFRDLTGSVIGIALSLSQGALLDYSGHNYRLTLLFGAASGALTALCLARLAWRQRVKTLSST